jgi:hypothetical protein
LFPVRPLLDSTQNPHPPANRWRKLVRTPDFANYPIEFFGSGHSTVKRLFVVVTVLAATVLAGVVSETKLSRHSQRRLFFDLPPYEAVFRDLIESNKLKRPVFLCIDGKDPNDEFLPTES